MGNPEKDNFHNLSFVLTKNSLLVLLTQHHNKKGLFLQKGAVGG